MKKIVNFLILLLAVTVTSNSVCADISKEELRSTVEDQVRITLNSLATSDGPLEGVTKSKILERAKVWASPVMRLQSETYGVGFCSWVSNSIDEEARGLGLNFLRDEDASRNAFDSTIKLLNRVFGSLTTERAESLLKKRNQNLMDMKKYAQMVETSLLTKLRSLDVVHLQVSDEDEKRIFSEARRMLGSKGGEIWSVEEAVIEPSGSAFVQSYLQMMVRQRILVATRGNWYSVYSIASPLYDPNDQRYHSVWKTFPQVEVEYLNSMGRIWRTAGSITTINFDGLEMVIWDVFQGPWLPFRRFEIPAEKPMILKFKFDRKMVQKMEQGLEGSTYSRFNPESQT